MKTESNQTAPSAPVTRASFYQPDRHYVTVQAPDNTWDGDLLDRLQDIIDPATNELAYRVEADGRTADGRKITGDRRKVLLSCSLDYIKKVEEQNSNASIEQARSFEQAPKTRSRSVDGRSVATVEDESFGTKHVVGL